MAYVSLAEFKTWIGSTVDDDDHHLEPILEAAARYINRRTGRHFTRETGVTKLYYPTQSGRISVTDLITITSLKIDTAGDRSYSTTLATTDYELLPYLDDSGLPAVRFQEIRIWPRSTRAFRPYELVQIVGDFGYVDDNDQTPSDIRLLTLILASRYWKRHETPLGILGAADLGQFERISREDPDAANLIQQYSRTRQWVVV